MTGGSGHSNNAEIQGMSNLMGRINEYGNMINQNDVNLVDLNQNQEKPAYVSQELEIFLSGGGDGTMCYKYKKAALDFAKMQGSADGAIMLRVNCPVADGQPYAIKIPKKL